MWGGLQSWRMSLVAPRRLLMARVVSVYVLVPCPIVLQVMLLIMRVQHIRIVLANSFSGKKPHKAEKCMF